MNATTGLQTSTDLAETIHGPVWLALLDRQDSRCVACAAHASQRDLAPYRCTVHGPAGPVGLMVAMCGPCANGDVK